MGVVSPPLRASSFSQRRVARRANSAHGAMFWKETRGDVGIVALQVMWRLHVTGQRSLKDSAENQKTGEGKGFHRPSGKALKKGEEQQKQEGSVSEVAKEESVTSTETMKGLLEEANRMLQRPCSEIR